MTAVERPAPAGAGSASPRIPLAAHVGTVVGIHGWLIGLLIALLASGDLALTGDLLLVGLPVSLALSALVVACRECLHGVLGRGQMLVLTWGLLLLAIGVLLVVINHWLAPRLEASPRALEVLARLGAVWRTSDAVSASCLVAAALLLVLVARGVRRRSG